MFEGKLGEFTDDNRYKLVRRIADGGMGSVFEAILFGTEGFQKTVTIKTIKENLTGDRDFVNMFIGEAKLVADLVHQNIVQIYQLGKLNNTYYIAMEYIQGINLQQFMDRHAELGKKVPLELGTWIISRVCRGLEYAHNKRDKEGHLLGVVHRDVSPKNIMISSEGEIKLTDFGIAKARNLMQDQEGNILMGKVQYMSPEQAQYKTTDRRSDIFSLGIVFYELLTGYNVFDDHETTKVLDNVSQKEIPKPSALNPDIPENLEKIMLKMLERDVTKRYQDSGTLGYDLEYHIYHKGYGPTIVTMERYMRTLFPRLYVHPLQKKSTTALPTALPEKRARATVDSTAETITTSRTTRRKTGKTVTRKRGTTSEDHKMTTKGKV